MNGNQGRGGVSGSVGCDINHITLCLLRMHRCVGCEDWDGGTSSNRKRKKISRKLEKGSQESWLDTRLITARVEEIVMVIGEEVLESEAAKVGSGGRRNGANPDEAVHAGSRRK